MTAEFPSATPFDARLLAAATTLGGELSLSGLATRLGSILSALPEVRFAAVGLFEHERGLFRGVTVPWPATPDTVEFELPATLIEPDLTAARRAAIPPAFELRRPGLHVLHRWAVAAGATSHWSAGVWLGERLAGGLLVGTSAREAEAAEARAFLHRLALILAPVLWNCVTEERFARGDRRRDALIALYKSINTSLRFDGVLAAAHAVLTEVAGPDCSSIDLFDDDGRTYRAYATAPADVVQSAAGRQTPPRREIAGTALAHIQLQGTTYVSDDLAARAAFEDDRQWHGRGFRRYVATPLQARGRLLGALLVGARDPHPILQIDVWLYEHIAVQLALALDNARQHEEVQRLSDRLREQNVYLREEIQREHDFAEMVGRTPALRRVLDDVARVAPTDTIVLIGGETGVGKELVARAIHAASPRAGQPMVKVNCAAIPEGLVESELFGHERGAFTSAVEQKIGRFELAIDGTLFLDEVGELPLPVQSKMLRVLQDGEFERVGGTKTLRTNARILAATNRNLLAEVDAGRFRRDLYYRLNVFPLHVPPLRERREDIALLVEAFATQFARRMGKRIEKIDPACLAELALREWPGNVRELRHVIERAMILCDGPVLHIESALPAIARRSIDHGGTPPLTTASPPPAATAGAAAALRAAEAELIRNALHQTNWIIEGARGAAGLLQMTPSTLRYRMKRLGIRRR